MAKFRKPSRRDVTIGLGAFGAGALVGRLPDLHAISLLGGGEVVTRGPVSLQSLGNLRFSYSLPELFRFGSFAKPDANGLVTTIFYPNKDDAAEEAYLNGCGYTGAAQFDHAGLPSDMYLARVGRHYCPVVVPATGEKNSICVITPDHTYRAYNKFGGKNLYDEEVYDKHGYENGSRPYHRLSWFNNPIKLNIFSYLRRYGFEYDVSSHDLIEHDPESVSGYKLIILYGHDEYWSEKFRAAIERHLLDGGSLLNLSGNTCYWRVRIDGDLMRLTRRDGADLWSRHDPEQKLLGACFTHAGFALPMRFRDDEEGLIAAVRSIGHPALPPSMGADALKRKLTGIRLVDVDHPVFEGSGLREGDWIGTKSKIVIHELDGIPLKRDSTVDWSQAKHFPRDIRVYGEAWAIWPSEGPDARIRHAGVMNEFRYEGRGTVLGFPTVGWARALLWDEPEIVAITSNAIRYLLDKA